jgi:hypothetical protein
LKECAHTCSGNHVYPFTLLDVSYVTQMPSWGSLNVYCKSETNAGSGWFESFRNALSKPQQLSLLSMSVKVPNLHPVVEALVEIRSSIRQLKITYNGNRHEIIAAAAPLALLGSALTMAIDFEEGDRGDGQASAWLQLLIASRVNLVSLSLRYTCRRIQQRL